jgi:hypothetical protein
MAYLSIDLHDIPIDQELVNRIPYGLALYYLALPLARENGTITVAMARPDNQAALLALRGLLGGEIVPVQGAADDIRAAINYHHAPEKPPEARILAWSASAGLKPAVAYLATVFSVALNAPVTILDATQVDVRTALTIACEGQYALTVLTPSDDMTVSELLRHSTTPLLLVRGDHCRLQRILFSSRGYASDDRALEWVMPVWKQGTVMTWLPLLEESLQGLAGALAINGPTRRHIEQRLRRLEQGGGPVQLRLRQGTPADQAVAEALDGEYDLLVISTEGEGDFVAGVLRRLEAQNAHAGRPIFILRPPFPMREESRQAGD